MAHVATPRGLPIVDLPEESPHAKERSNMARPGPASFAKRKRELEKKRKRQEKLQLRAERRAQKAERGDQHDDGQDPDLKGIVAGPQPPRRD